MTGRKDEKGDEAPHDDPRPQQPASRRGRAKWPPQRIAVLVLLLALLALVIYLKATGVV